MNIKIMTLALFSCVALSVAGCSRDETPTHTPLAEKISSDSHDHADHSDHDDHADEGGHAAHEGHDHAGHFGHSCSIKTPMGLGAVFARAPIVVIGTVDTPEQVDGEHFSTTLTVEETLKGQLDGGVTLNIQADHGQVGVVAGERLMLALTQSETGYQLLSIDNGVVQVDQAGASGAKQLVTSLINAEVNEEGSKNAIVSAIVDGGAITRYRAVFDISPEHYSIFTASDFDALTSVLLDIETHDRSMDYLMIYVGMSKNAERAASLMSLIDRPEAMQMKLFETLSRVGAMRGIKDGVANALQPYLGQEQSDLTRRIAAFVMARSEGEGTREKLVELLDDADADVVSEAMIGLAGSGNSRVRSMAYDAVNVRLESERVVDGETELASEIRARQLIAASSEWHAGDNLRFMAAGYVLVRTGDVKDANWMKNRLGFIKDFGVRKFIETKIAFITHSYDHKW